MKKLSLILGICTALTACTYMDPDLDSAQATRDANRDTYRQEFGCTLTDDHAAYRNCILNTYHDNKPKTYTITTNKDGKSVAVIKNETKKYYDEDTNTYKTERVIVIETEERLVQVPASTVNPIPTTDTVAAESSKEDVVVEKTAEVENTTKETVNDINEPVEPEEQKTWWDTYQEIKEVEMPAEPVCPCPDPNDPCPQCVDK